MSLKIKQSSAVFGRDSDRFFGTDAAKGCQFFGHIADIGRFIALTAMGLGRQVGLSVSMRIRSKGRFSATRLARFELG